MAIAPRGDKPLWAHLRSGVGYYYATSTVVTLGVLFGGEYVAQPAGSATSHDSALARLGGEAYGEVLRSGYEYDGAAPSSIARFPAYPLLGRALSEVGGLAPSTSLIIVSHICLAAAMVFFARYAQRRFEGAPPEAVTLGLLALGLFPAGLFFRCAYTESLFLLLSVLAMYGMLVRWPILLCAAIVGLGTAARPVGVALLLPLAWHAWETGRTGLRRWIWAASMTFVGCWGLTAFMVYQQCTFGDALAFAKTHEHWRVQPPITWNEEWIALGTLQPIWTVYAPGSPGYWARCDVGTPACFSLLFANPLYFLLAIGLTWLGKRKGWLNWPETLLVAGLIAIPYVTRGYDMAFGSMGRFVSVAFPTYLVIGRLLAGAWVAATSLILLSMGLLLFVYSALYAAGYFVN